MSYSIKSRGKTGILFTNWSNTFFCRPELFFVPENVHHLKEIIRLAHLENKKIRVVGCGHSPSDIACSKDYLISLRQFDRILHVDPERHQVKVEGGVMVVDLISYLEKHGLALRIAGSVSSLTLAGAICTATHGSGVNFGNLSTLVVSMEILTSAGEIIEVSRDNDLELFQAACCSLGALGIIISITYQCEKAYSLELNQYPCPLHTVLENLEVHLKSSEHFRFLWFPHTPGTVVSHINRTTKKIVMPSRLSKWHSWFWEYLVGYYVLELSYYISTLIPSSVPFINRLFYNLLYSKPRKRVDQSQNIFNFECLFKQYVNEWSIPIDKTATVLIELENWFSQNTDVRAHFPIEVRFVKGDDLLISPSHGRDSCYINIIMYRPYGKLVDYIKYWNAYEDIMTQNGGRPHWAKAHKVGPMQLKEMYPMYAKFCQIRKKLDPTDTFVNSYMERIL
uniref:L-gulonolactone oxidase n=1 Tax=Strigamia maritima TaxID=126957 RepID=T1JBA5_STRMM